VAFRFSDRNWAEYPLTAAKYAHWLHRIRREESVVSLFMDYETFGEHQWEETGIFTFLSALPGEILRHPEFEFRTPAEVASDRHPAGEIDCPEFISWADEQRDTTAWLGNAMQQDAAHTLYKMESAIRKGGDEDLLKRWRMLQTSDHFYYMCTKWFSDGDVHRYFNPYESPYEAYINYMNVIDDLSQSIKGTKGESP
jgi:alpha-amylase